MALMVTACGFQLRGTANVASDIKSISLQVSDRAFQRTLADTLAQTGITVTTNAPYSIHVVNLDHSESVGTTSGGGIVTDYDVTGTVRWQLVGQDGLVLIPQGELQQRGTYQRHNNDYNTSQGEQDRAWNEVMKNLAVQLTYRIAALSETELSALTEKAISKRETAERVDLPASSQGQ